MKIKQIPYQAAIIITLSVYLYYLVYRVRYTINPDCLILSLSFFIRLGEKSMVQNYYGQSLAFFPLSLEEGILKRP